MDRVYALRYTPRPMTWRKQLWARKSIEVLLAEMAGEHRLRRCLGPVSLTALGVGAIIGAGIFVLTGLAAHDFAGPGLVLSFTFAGLGCAFAALCYAEFASTVPVAGSAYTYAYATLGELFAWIIGWDLVLEYAVASSTVAHGWSHYLAAFLNLFGVAIPAACDQQRRSTTTSPAGQWLITGALPQPAGGAGIVLAMTVVLVIGIRESARFNAAMVWAKLAVVLFVIASAPPTSTPRNWHPFLPFGFGGVLQGAAYVFFAYIGFDAVSTHAEEASNPQRDVPIGIIVSLLLCTVLYIPVAAVLTGMVPYRRSTSTRRWPRPSPRQRSERGGVLHLDWRPGRHHQRAAGADAQRLARAAGDGARRAALALVLRRRPSALPHAAQGDHRARRWRSRPSPRCSRSRCSPTW